MSLKEVSHSSGPSRQHEGREELSQCHIFSVPSFTHGCASRMDQENPLPLDTVVLALTRVVLHD